MSVLFFIVGVYLIVAIAVVRWRPVLLSLLAPAAMVACAVAAITMLVRIFHDLSIGWGIGLAFYFAVFMAIGHQSMIWVNNWARTPDNATLSACITSTTGLLIGLAFAYSRWPHELSALWAWLTPLVLIAVYVMQRLALVLLNALHPAGRGDTGAA